ncbi:sensor histidine kinase [Microbacterium aoyamense]|uniref:histidine kinase n=1 Tax=Microbacterium aoyamense TaxID=344166 RepID=A0ABN2PX72_9MICO|nr:PAS domain-containing sensor histidine kinase [Microbacterium aoyamense]
MASPVRASRISRGELFEGRTRARTALLNQLLLGAVVLLLAIVGFVRPFEGDRALFYLAVVIVFVATAAAIVVPWNRIPATVSAVVPIVDVVAIAMMSEASSTSGFSLLFIFPAMWLAGSFGMPGLVFGVASICIVYTVQSITDENDVSITTLLPPFAVIALATTSYITARRARMQRYLLDAQTRLLGQALSQARQQEETVTEVLDAVDFGIIRIDADGRIAVTNEAHWSLQSFPDPADPTGPPIVRPAYARDGITLLAARRQPLARALRGEAFDDEVVWFGEPGEERRALTITTRRVHNDDGSPAGAVVISRDITVELSAIRAREDLVASVSHELRTPLTSIVGYLELVLDEEGLAPSARRGLEVAERNANRLLTIIADILAASGRGRSTIELSIHPEPTDISVIAAAAVELQTPRAAERGITIDASGLEPAIANVDPSRLRQVLDNLLSNAVKYNVDDGTIDVGTTADADHAWIVVRDSGTGISDTELPQLFGRFFRADAVRKTSTHGSGLGLSISRDIIRSHGGEITVQSELGVGTTFVVRLPLRAAPATGLIDVVATPTPQEES